MLNVVTHKTVDNSVNILSKSIKNTGILRFSMVLNEN